MRLSDSVVMASALESPAPVRFIFVLVGPSQSGVDYSESGRAMGALMADWVRERRIAASDHTTSVTIEAYCVSALTGVLSGGLLGPD